MTTFDIDNALRKTKKEIKRAKVRELVFSVITTCLLISALTTLFIYLPINPLVSLLLICATGLLVITECVLSAFFLFKEKRLKVVNFLSNAKPLMILPLFGLGQFFACWQTSLPSMDEPTIYSLFATAWTIFGISVAAISIWFGLSFRDLNTHGSKESMNKPELAPARYEKYMDYIMASVMAIVLLLNAILLVSASVSLRNVSNDKTGGFIFGTLVFSSFTAFDLLVFFLLPLFRSVLEHAHSDNVHYIEILRLSEAMLKETKKLKDALDALKQKAEIVRGDKQDEKTLEESDGNEE